MMMLIRRFEEKTFQAYQQPGQKIGGFLHLYSGQEAIAVGIASIFRHGMDALINGYRCHGHSLALGMSPRAAIAELFGKETGCSKGKGGSMHPRTATTADMASSADIFPSAWGSPSPSSIKTTAA
jgi:pyruvate dehydrogenase E1 component alpha subunit